MDVNHLIVLDSSTGFNIAAKENLDEFLSVITDVSAWEYDINSRTMALNFYGHDNDVVNTVIIKNFRKTVIDYNLIFAEDQSLFEMFCSDIDAAKENITAEYRRMGRNKDFSWCKQTGMAVMGIDERPAKVVGRAYTSNRDSQDKHNDSTQDPLTGLFNRTKLETLVKSQLIDRNVKSAALVIIDVDDFHEINDTFGKMQGDSVLQTISGLIYTNFMSRDIVGRIAGDQFMVFCANIDKEKLTELVDNLLKRIRANVANVNGHPITASAGIAHGPEDGMEYDILLTKADMALNYAKNTGKNRLCSFELNNMRAECLGYVLLKKDKFREDENRITKAAQKVNKKLFDFAFEELSKEPDFRKASEKIFSEVCLYYGLDRAVMHEMDATNQTLSITSHWCKVDDGDDAGASNPMTFVHWGQIEDVANKRMDKEYMVMNNGRGEGLDFFREIITLKCPPVDAVYFPIVDNGNMIAMIIFDAFYNHEFKKNELSTLNSVVRLIRSYLLSTQVKYELQTESVINKNVMDAQKIIYYIVDERNFTIKYLSPYAKDIFNRAEYGMNCYEGIRGTDHCCDNCPIKAGLCNGSITEFYDERLDRWFTMTANRMKDTESDHDILICVTDVTEFLNKVRGEDTLTVADSYDKFVINATRQVLLREDNYSVICAGIRSFSKINDKYGYVVGDEILKNFAMIMKESMSDKGMICRVKGDDFVLLVKDSEVAAFRKRMEDAVRHINVVFRERFPFIDIQCFFGRYKIKESDEYINKCIDNAMKARNLAMDDKSSRGGYSEYTSELDDKKNQEDMIAEMIRQALDEDRVKVYFQPKVDVNNGFIIGAEALVRMVDREGKIISPGLFIPVAEKNGQILDVDYRVYEKTFEYMQKWQKNGKKVPLVSVNVSRIHMTDDSLPQIIKNLSDRYGLRPSQIELEITESVFFDDANRIIDMIKKLKSLGYKISMDDFGSGYSTLNFMKSLPVDIIKIDGGFFMRNEMDKKSKAVISAIMQLTENLEFETVSEGVETQEQVDFIKSQGGKCVQGYYFYKPMLAEEFEKLI